MISEEMIVLQNEVHTLEDRVYGNPAFGSPGLYGVLKDCRETLVDKVHGGDGRFTWIETIERVIANEKDIWRCATKRGAFNFYQDPARGSR